MASSAVRESFATLAATVRGLPSKRNLLLLLTPYIIRDPADFHDIFRRKMREREEFLEFFGREDLGYVADIDFSRKNGPLESMVQTIRTAFELEEARRRAQGLHDRPQLQDSLEASPPSSSPTSGCKSPPTNSAPTPASR